MRLEPRVKRVVSFMDRRQATAIACQMNKANPTHSNERVLQRFSQALDAAEG